MTMGPKTRLRRGQLPTTQDSDAVPGNARKRMDDTMRENDATHSDDEDLSRDEKSVLWTPTRNRNKKEK